MSKFLSEENQAQRVAYIKKVTNLSSGFKFANGVPFSIFIKSDSDDLVTITAKPYFNASAVECPVRPNDWTPIQFAEIGANATMTSVEVYIGSGYEAVEEV